MRIGGFTLSQWPSEAKFVAIRIDQVKEPLGPFGIARCRVWSVAGRDHGRVEGVDVGMVDDAEAAKEKAKRILMETKIADATRVGLLNEEGVEVFEWGPEPLMLRGRVPRFPAARNAA